MPDSREFDEIARTIFAPAYPVIAAQIVQETGIREGFCLDIGCGGGYLGLAIADMGPFDLGFLDPSDGMRDLAARNAIQKGLKERFQVLSGTAEAIPLPENCVDLAVSRGSVFFWSDPVMAFREIYRVLKPAGKAMVGGGFGSARIRDDIIRKMEERNNGKDNWRKKVSGRLGPDAVQRFARLLDESGLPDCRVNQDPEKGLWITIKKENSL
ncbi:MAG: class I SAM-dependent methyltransferase [Proteobacteria bacterium]|nr:class I SAM-dependent methyltransferase [Pseudomonadota bacterium]